MSPCCPRIAVTPGEPAGIGPDLCVQLAQRPHQAELVAVADPALLEARARQLRMPLSLKPVDFHQPPQAQQAGCLKVLEVGLPGPVVCGVPDVRNAAYVLETLRAAVAACLQGRLAGLVTGPVHKGIINEAGFPFSGHTEFLAALTKAPQAVMMLLADGLRVALATTHLPLRAVCDAIDASLLVGVLRVLEWDLRQQFGIQEPRILVCGLNPHAGEDGHLGREDEDIVKPVLAQLRNAGMQLIGPLPADTLFIPKYLDRADAVLAMYHDQGLPVLKSRGFGRAVNITLGLPLIRTSVDHGTALELAGSGHGEAGSLAAALQLATEIVLRRSAL